MGDNTAPVKAPKLVETWYDPKYIHLDSDWKQWCVRLSSILNSCITADSGTYLQTSFCLSVFCHDMIFLVCLWFSVFFNNEKWLLSYQSFRTPNPNWWLGVYLDNPDSCGVSPVFVPLLSLYPLQPLLSLPPTALSLGRQGFLVLSMRGGEKTSQSRPEKVWCSD